MDADEYQKLTGQTEIYTRAAAGFSDKMFNDALDHRNPNTQQEWLKLAYCTGKLNGEAGEVAEIIFKALRDGSGNPGEITPEMQMKLFKELGDVSWYLARLADLLGWKLSDVFKGNIDKLMDRKERGVLSGSGDER